MIKVSQLSPIDKLLEWASNYRFLVWVILPLASLVGVGIWFELGQVGDQFDEFEYIVSSGIDYGSESQTLSDNATLSLIHSLQISSAVNFLLLVSSLAVMVFSVLTITRNLGRKKILVPIIVAGVIASTGILTHLYSDENGHGLADWYFTFWSEYLRTELEDILWIGRILVFSTNISVGLTVVAASTFLSPQTYTFNEGASQKKSDTTMKGKVDIFRILLYASSIQMTVGVVGIYFGLSVNVAPNSPDLQASLTKIASSMTLLYGVGYTVFLATAFLPSLFSLSTNAYQLTVDNTNKKTLHETLEDRGIKFSFIGEFKEFSVVLGPLVAGVATSLLDLETI